nr:retrotransposon protein, putative, unclassified [Tanacetum cinerariifolium]
MVPGCRLRHDDGAPVDEKLFKQLVGSLMYITTTRPDIQFVVSFISRFMSKPTETHFAAAKRVMRCKHIGVRFHFIRDLVSKGIVSLEYVETKEQVADILTKPLHR